jgi:hypothetical protein
MMDARIGLLGFGCLLFGAVIFFELSADGVEPHAKVEIPPPSPAVTAERTAGRPKIDELADAALSRPLFSPTRRPPDQAPGESTAVQDIAGKRLTGIIVDPDRKLAVFAVSGGKPLILTIGDTVDGWHIESISPGEVSLSGPGGTRSLQPKSDPSLVRQAVAVATPAPPPPSPNPAPETPPRGRMQPTPPVSPAAALRPQNPPSPPLPRAPGRVGPTR